MDLINENIDREVEKGKEQKAELRMASKKGGVEGMDGNDQREMDMDMQLFGPGPGAASTSSSDDFHSLSSLISEMETACDGIEREIDGLDKGADSILSDLNLTVGEMSDLRYGKFQGSTGQNADEVVDETVEALGNFENACNRSDMS